MNQEIKERVIQESEFILASNDTVRATAKAFGVSKSTVHVDVSKRLKKIDKKMYEKIKIILDNNFNEKHIRGGNSTRKKYLSKDLFPRKNERNK